MVASPGSLPQRRPGSAGCFWMGSLLADAGQRAMAINVCRCRGQLSRQAILSHRGQDGHASRNSGPLALHARRDDTGQLPKRRSGATLLARLGDSTRMP
eukprot:4040923-Alexandrium_andersonii.AAC.1